MDSVSPNQPSQPGLPPVLPPSGRFIAQLFVVPGLLITVVVLLVLGLNYLGRRDREPAYFLQQLDSDNDDIRSRGKNDLAQILKRSETAALRWKTDARFALDLADRLDAVFKDILSEEKKIAEEIALHPKDVNPLAWHKLQKQRDYLGFLAASLAEFHVPVGAPLLCTILEHDQSPDLKGNTLQRRKVLWALMNMGENAKGFAKIPMELRQKIVADLTEESAQGTPTRAGWARTGLYYLDKSALSSGASIDVVKVDDALQVCAGAEDRFLRAAAAMAFNFWPCEQAEATLLKLAADDGHGTLLRVEANE